MSNNFPLQVTNVLNELKIDKATFLGSGGEGYIFSYKTGSVVKIYTKAGITKEYLDDLSRLQKRILKANLPFNTPEIYEINELNGTYYAVEKALSGVSLENKFPIVSHKDKLELLRSYYDASKLLGSIQFPDLPYGNILNIDSKITNSAWPNFLVNKARQRVRRAGQKLRDDLPNIDEIFSKFELLANKHLMESSKSLVHADYFINQVLVNDQNQISAVIDISYHAVVGDYRLDIASTPIFYGNKDYTEEFVKLLNNLAISDYGEEIIKYNDIYKIYYCLYFSNIYKYIPSFYNYILRSLNDKLFWKRVDNY